MLDIKMPIIVEGKYDRLRVLSVANATVISTDGFGIFSKKETQKLIQKLAKSRGVIVLTDSDGGGLVIRNHLRSILPPESVTHVYIPRVEGKERRKKAPSKEGLLGVEGMEREVIERVLAPYSGESPSSSSLGLTKADLFSLGLSGGEDSSARRAKLADKLGLPTNLSASALLEAINITVSKEEFDAAIISLEES